MDKKSFIFIFTMIISFFLINQWYSSKNQEKLLQNMQNEASFATTSQEQLNSFTINPTDLPMTTFSAVPLDEMGARYGLMFNRSVVTIQPKNPPKQISVKKGTGLQVMDLIYSSDDGFCFYSENIDAMMNTAFLPQLKQIPVIFVPMNKEYKNLAYGTYQNQKVTLKAPFKEDAIVLVQDGKGFLPIGVYFAKSKRFELLSSYDLLRDFLSFKSAEIADVNKQEQFYVLENDFQQIVFSNFGGAIAEINLPFKSKENASVVLPVQFDRVIQSQYPYEASFPVVKALGVNQSNQTYPYKPKIGGYYPLLRRDLMERDGKKSHDLQSRFYALNLLYNGTPVSKSPYTLKRFEKDLIEFELNEGGRKITKTYRLPKENKAPYSILLTVKVDGDAKGLYLSTGVPEVELVGGTFIPLLQYAQEKKDQFIVEKVKLPKATYLHEKEKISYIANTNGYFGLMLSAGTNLAEGFAASFIPGNLAPTRISVIDAQYDRFPEGKYPGYELMLPLDPTQKVASYAFYAGPIQEDILQKADLGIASVMKNPGFKDAQTYYGITSFISEPFSKFLFLLMKMFYSITHSWGFSIILLTVALRVMLYPLNNWAATSMLKQQEAQPKLQALQEKYKKDPARLQQEMLRFYRENKINPLSAFLPLLIQIPFVIGLLDLLKSAFQLRGASFIPGWIDNLSAPDILFSWSYPIPFIGNSFHLLPILLGAIMYLQQKLNAPKTDPNSMTDQQRQAQVMSTVFTFLFPLMFYHFASGLNIYWLFSTLLAILQQVWTKRMHLKKKES